MQSDERPTGRGRSLGRRARVTAVAALLTSLVSPVAAQWAASDEPLPARGIVMRLQRQGFSAISYPRFDGSAYTVEATGPWGARVRLVIDAFDGDAIARRRIEEGIVPPLDVGPRRLGRADSFDVPVEVEPPRRRYGGADRPPWAVEEPRRERMERSPFPDEALPRRERVERSPFPDQALPRPERVERPPFPENTLPRRERLEPPAERKARVDPAPIGRPASPPVSRAPSAATPASPVETTPAPAPTVEAARPATPAEGPSPSAVTRAPAPLAEPKPAVVPSPPAQANAAAPNAGASAEPSPPRTVRVIEGVTPVPAPKE